MNAMSYQWLGPLSAAKKPAVTLSIDVPALLTGNEEEETS
jgi:hypothetical protein